MAFYKLEVPDDLWKKFKVKCAIDGISMVGKIIEMITKYVNSK
jgi:hypothetical protein